jgi:hypothetical protein
MRSRRGSGAAAAERRGIAGRRLQRLAEAGLFPRGSTRRGEEFMRRRLGHAPRKLLILPACLVFVALALTGGAGAIVDENGMEQESLVEVIVPDRGALDRLVGAGVDVAEYVRHNDDGTLTTQVFVTDEELEALRAEGYQIGETIQDYYTYLARMAERQATLDANAAAAELAETGEGGPDVQAAGLRSVVYAKSAAIPEITIQRVDYYQNYGGRFLSVEAYNSATTNQTPTSNTIVGPSMAMSWKPEGGDYGTASNMSRYIDSDPTPDTYLYHRVSIRIGAVGSTTPVPKTVRIASSTGAVAEAPVKEFIEGNPQGEPFPAGFESHFFDHYMDPTEVYDAFEQIATEYPNISQLISLPHLTPGYQRYSAAIMAATTTNPAPNIGSAPGGTPGTSGAVVLTAKKYGQDGGNNIRAQFRNPGVADSPLTVTVTPNTLGQSDIVVDLATNATGGLSSTAAQVVAAINASPAASALVTAETWASNAGAGITQARSLVNLSDFLAAPSTVKRGPFRMKVLRIGKHRDGSRTGIYIYCQEHAREWVTPLTCYELAMRLTKNYDNDPETKDFVDNLDIFIVPSVNPDGSHISFYDFASKRRNMPNYCAPGTTNAMPSARNSWGVDLNRNNTQYTLFDGYFGASTSCTNDTFAGLSELSEAETKNSHWVVDTFDNIKFSMNTHSSGGLFMWSPASYIGAGRITAPYPNIGIEGYFWTAADITLRRIKEYRGTVIDPQTTGPVADVLYSAAGNSADDYFYRKGIIAYSFEVGADRTALPLLQVASVAGATGVRATTTAGMTVGNEIRIDVGKNLEVRTITGIVTPNPASPAPNVLLDAPLALPHVTSTQLVTNGTSTGSTVGVGFMPSFAVEGQYEGMEFANGHYGLIEAALAYQRDHTPPVATTKPESAASQTPIDVTFEWVNEPSVIHYTTDGSLPTMSSPTWEAQGPRRPGEIFTFDQTTHLRWLAVDIAGNSSYGDATFSVDTTAPTTTASLAPAAQNGYYRNPFVSLLADDDVAGGGSGIEKTEYNLDGGGWQTYSTPFQVTGDGNHTLLFRSIDKAGNQEADQSLTFEVDGTGPAITITTPPDGAVYKVGQSVLASYSCSTTGAALASCTGPVANGSAVNTASIGTKTFMVSATDAAGNSTSASTQYKVVWPFKGFAFTWLLGSPFDAKPGAYGEAKAGDDIPVFFTLGGNYGLNVLAAGSPASASINCANLTKPWYLAKKKSKLAKAAKKKRKLAHGTQKEFGSLSYVRLLGVYTFEWNTNKDWKNTCRMLSVSLDDGTTHTALFKLKK